LSLVPFGAHNKIGKRDQVVPRHHDGHVLALPPQDGDPRNPDPVREFLLRKPKAPADASDHPRTILYAAAGQLFRRQFGSALYGAAH
jgi:hypothetical protein